MQKALKRIAVVGLFNSGSSGLAAMLHHLGANMGPPFWSTDEEGDPFNYYEPVDLSWHLRMWWNEPEIVEKVPSSYRARFFRQWALLQDCAGPAPVGAKHPLLSVCGPDLVQAWGSDTLFLWSYRPFEESLARFHARHWYPVATGEHMQRRLWDSLHQFAASHSGVVKIPWKQVKSDPAWAAEKLADLAELKPSTVQLQKAVASIRPERPSEHPSYVTDCPACH